MNPIALTATQRETLLSLQLTSTLYNTTQDRLTTGKKVNTASDNAVAYFQSQSLYDHASNLTDLKSNIDQNIQALNVAQTATSAVEGLLQQLKAVAEGAQSGTVSQRVAATVNFTSLANQLSKLVTDSTYQGLNLLTSTNAALVTQFSDQTTSSYTVSGFNLIDPNGGNTKSLFTQGAAVFNSQGSAIFSALVGDAAGAGGSPATSIAGFSQLNLTASQGAAIPGSQAQIIFTATVNRISAAISQVQSITGSLGTNVGILQARADFTTHYVNDLNNGGDKLTLADLNTEAANSQALSLRQQLGLQSLSVTNNLNQAVLNLIK